MAGPVGSSVMHTRPAKAAGCCECLRWMVGGGGPAADPPGQPGQSISLSKVSWFEDLRGRPAWEPSDAPIAACGCGSSGEGGGGEEGGIEGVPVLVSAPRATPSSELNFEGRRAEQHETARDGTPFPPHVDPLTATGLGGSYGPSRLGESFFAECYCMVVVHYAYVVYYAVCELVHDKTSGTHREALCFTTQDEQ